MYVCIFIEGRRPSQISRLFIVFDVQAETKDCYKVHV